MKRTFHLVGAEEWQPAGGLWRPASLEGQGFVHLSFAEQLQGTLDLHFPGRGPLWLLEVDPGALENLVLEAVEVAVAPNVAGHAVDRLGSIRLIPTVVVGAPVADRLGGLSHTLGPYLGKPCVENRLLYATNKKY